MDVSSGDGVNFRAEASISLQGYFSFRFLNTKKKKKNPTNQVSVFKTFRASKRGWEILLQT